MSAFTIDRVHEMSESTEPNTRTVRIATQFAKKLQTISALRDEMGEKFKSVEFLNGLVGKAIDELYDQTLRAFDDFKRKGKKK